jgi:hypothetical protein
MSLCPLVDCGRLNTVRFRTTPITTVTYSIAECKGSISWWPKNQNWFTGSILLLAISVLGFAYLFWESYLVTRR